MTRGQRLKKGLTETYPILVWMKTAGEGLRKVFCLLIRLNGKGQCLTEGQGRGKQQRLRVFLFQNGSPSLGKRARSGVSRLSPDSSPAISVLPSWILTGLSMSGPLPESHDFFHDAAIHDNLHLMLLGQPIAFGAPDAFLDPDSPDSAIGRFPDHARNVRRLPENDDHIRCFWKGLQRGMAFDVSYRFENRIDGKHRVSMILQIA
ncbi:hypothetical protein BOX30_06030 [Leptospirillum ferriphilum]|uniref:Uncharacterized protein n=1 Tax=Leptospirillum ferriphilum TaxID=178606 RepID=A0A1V3SVU8_9BACT|nr:hypothetical protein BOX24_06100 [Leptospirillum ferriphilum]OOH80351.1 hypothetical protein BOX30_06030 [Leptospirillum ferriphilum]